MATNRSNGKKNKTAEREKTNNASSKKNTSPKKRNNAAKFAGEQKSLNLQEGMNWTLKREVWYLCAFLVVLMLLLGLLLNESFGSVGHSIHTFFVGVFGIGAYFLLGGILIFILFNIRYPNRLMRPSKVLCLGVMVWFISAIMHIINASELSSFSAYYDQAHWYTGGVIGGLIGHTLFDLFGKVGAVILLIGLLILCSVIISEKSLVSLMNLLLHKTKSAATSAKKRVGEKVREYQENTQQMLEEAEREQSDAAAMDAVEENRHYDPYHAYSEKKENETENPYQKEAEKMQRRSRAEHRRAAVKQKEPNRRREEIQNDYSDGYASDREEILNEVRKANETYMNDPSQNPFLIESTRPEAIPDENGLLPWVKEDNGASQPSWQSIKEKQRENRRRRTSNMSRKEQNHEDAESSENKPFGDDWRESGWFKPLPEGKRTVKESSSVSNTASEEMEMDSNVRKERYDSFFASDSFVDESNINDPEDILIQEEPEFERKSISRSSKSVYDDSEEENSRETKNSQEPKAVEKAKPVTKAEQEKVNQTIEANLVREDKQVKYEFPSIELLDKPKSQSQGSKDELYRKAAKLQEVLESFNVEATVTAVTQGPAVTRFELMPKTGVRVNRIAQLQDDIALNLAASSIRIEAPIPGKSAVGIEIANEKASMVTLREILESKEFQSFPSKLAFCLGKTIDGEIKVWDIGRMPHLLIAGATGSGKSVCINTMLMSLLFKADPKDVKLILIDPKVVELSVYNGIPHLLAPVVNEPKKAAATLNWAVQEMTIRYKTFANWNVRDLKGYNELVKERAMQGELLEPMPQIVIIIDELADLMMVAGKEVEEAICRLAQMARAAGMHLVIATQRPSVDVITGVIKANIPSRLAFAVSSGIDSRTILDSVGAEKLLGHGDMLFLPIGANKATRIQGAFVSDHEVERVVNAVKPKDTETVSYNVDLQEQMEFTASAASPDEEKDEFLEQAILEVIKKQKCSSSYLQRVFRIGFNRAARLVDEMYERGIVGPDEGSKPRKVLVTMEEYEEMNKEEYPVDDTID